MHSIGSRLKVWRKSISLKQEEAAERVGLSPSTYQNYERDVRRPNTAGFDAFTRAGINAQWLLTGEGEMLLNQGAPGQAQLQAGQAQFMIAEPTTEWESPAQAYTAAARPPPDQGAALPDVTMLVSRCIIAAEMVAEGKLDRQQQVALGLDTWGALSRICGGHEKAARAGRIADTDLLLLARFVFNTKAAISPR